MYMNYCYNENVMHKNFTRFWIELLRSLIQATYAGLFIVPWVSHQLTMGFIVTCVACAIGFIYWAKKLCFQLDQLEEKG